MSLADHEPAPIETGRPCSIGKLLRELDPADQATLQTWLANRSYSPTAVYDSVRAAGHWVSLQQIGRHRQGICRCKK